ncbi:MAG: hypothetical protein KBS64_01645 [Treponema sp.]|nr:hypothetical protein [Candidatus Treponema equi]
MNVSSAGSAQSLYNLNSSPVLIADGQTIKVTCLKNNGDGTCLVSFGGGKFNVRTERPLAQGEVFAAVVKDVDGKIQLQPSEEKVFSDSFVRFMTANGFVPDEITAKVFQFMEQSGVRIDMKFMQKARAVALNFPGKEKAAAEIACMLLEKGIEPTEENVGALLVYLDPEKNQDGDSGSALENEGDDGEQDDVVFLEKLYKVLPCRKSGLLSFMNHYRTAGTSKHWVVLPYEWQLGEKKAGGLIKLLLNPDLGTTEKIQINCKISCKSYHFVLYLMESKVKEVRFCSLPPLLSSEILKEEKRLGELFCSGMNGDSVPVTYSALAYSEGLYSSSETPFSFEDIV